MKILVTVKRVIDFEAKLRIAANKKAIDESGINMIMNPFDEIAVEEALRIREAHEGVEVVVVSIGTSDVKQQIRSALAMGASRGIIVNTSDFLDSAGVAKTLKKIVEEEKPDIILMGKQSIDQDNRQTAEYLAEILNYGQATQANKIEVNVGKEKVEVIREVDGGLETVELSFPCVISVDLRLNEPRYASLPGIMRAKRATIAEKHLNEMNINVTPQIRILELNYPVERKSGQILANVNELFTAIKKNTKSI